MSKPALRDLQSLAAKRPFRQGAAAAAVIILALVINNHYYLNIAVFAGLNAMLAIGLNLLMGLAGQVSLGHAAFYALGAYGVGVLAVQAHWPAWACLPAALLLTGVVAYLIGWPTLRLKGHYLALATLGFGVLVEVLLKEMSGLTGGPSGLIGIPYLQLGGLVIKGDRSFALMVWLIILLVQAGLVNLRTSREGRALLAIHNNETAAASLGVDTGREKRAIFVAGAVLAGLAGGFYAYYINFISPETFNFGLSVQILTMTVVGGLGTVWGPVLGALLLTVIPEILRQAKDYDIILYGLILILAIAFLPGGLARAFQDLWLKAGRWLHERRTASAG